MKNIKLILFEMMGYGVGGVDRILQWVASATKDDTLVWDDTELFNAG